MRTSFRFALAFAGLFGLSPVWAGAQELRLETAVERALASHPLLRAQSADIAAAERASELDGLAPPLTVGGSVENVFGTGPLNGTAGAEITLRLGRVVELGGKREARLAVGRAKVARQRHSAELARIEVAAETSRRFVEVLADQHRVTIAREAVARAEQTVAQVIRWVEAGRSPDSEKHQAGIALGQAQLAREDAELRLLTARQMLSTLWGQRVPDFAAAVGDLDKLIPLESFESLTAKLPQSADQQGFQLDLATLDAHRRAASSAARPDISLALGVRRFEALDSQALVLDVSVPLGNAPRSALAGAQVQAQIDATYARRDTADDEVYQRLFKLVQQLTQERRVAETHRDSLIPQAEQALAVNQRGYDLGRFSLFVLLQSQQQLAQLRVSRLEAMARYHLLLVDIERLTATSGAATP